MHYEDLGEVMKPLLLTLIMLSYSLYAKNYFVDYEQGINTNKGTSPAAAWKNAPGDSSASDNSQAVVLAAGDTIFFKGGISYKSTFSPRSAKGFGRKNKPIVYKGDGWPGRIGVKAIVDGSDVISGWIKCISAAECDNNPKWRNIYYAPCSQPIDVLSSNLHLNDSALTLAQNPDPDNAFEMNVLNNNWYIVNSSNVSTTTLIDPRLKRFAGRYRDMFIAIHCYSSNVEIKKVTGFKSSTNTLSFEQLTHGPSLRKSEYSIVNSIDSVIFNKSREYYIKTDSVNGKKTVYALMPPGFNPQRDTVTISLRGGISIGNKNFITIQGFWIKKISGWAISTSGNYGNRGCGIFDNRIESIRSAVGGNLLYVFNNDAVIRGNDIRNIGNLRGLVVIGENVVISDNYFKNIGGTVIFASGCKNVRIVRNKIDSSLGSHSNGISTYADSNILVANNLVINTARPFTFKDAHNLCVFQNVFYHDPMSAYVVCQWGKNITGYCKIINNLIIGSSKNCSVLINLNAIAKYTMINNIIAGVAAGGPADDTNHYLRRNNIYVGLCWSQSGSNNWRLGIEEKAVSIPNTLFKDMDHYDFHPILENGTVDAGYNPLSILSPDTVYFKDVDFSLDIEGNKRFNGLAWDIGPYECN
jgi:hypothetical protein